MYRVRMWCVCECFCICISVSLSLFVSGHVTQGTAMLSCSVCFHPARRHRRTQISSDDRSKEEVELELENIFVLFSLADDIV